MKRALSIVALILGLNLAAGTLWGATLGGSEAGAERPPNLLLVTIDTWRWDYLGTVDQSQVQTPTLDALAQKGMVFTNTRVAAPVTLTSHSSIFTGLHPTAHGVHHNGIFALRSEHETLAEVLSTEGYQTAAVTGAYVVSSRYGLSQGFDAYLDVVSDNLYEKPELSASYPELNATEVTDRALRLLASFEPDRPFFLWVHYFDPHGEYQAPEPFRSRYAHNTYAAEVAYVDHELGRLLKSLEDREHTSRTAWLVTSDHGESLGEHGELNHGHFLFDSTLRVSTLMGLPGAPSGVRFDSQIRSVDLMPTLLEALSIPSPDAVQGESVRPVWEGKARRPRPAYAETYLPYYDYGWGYLRSMVLDDWKLVAGPEQRLYKLDEDPSEKSNLAARETAQLQRMSATLERMIAATSKAANSRVTTTGADRRVLASLGYLGGGTAPPPEETVEELQSLPDPGRMIHLEKLIWEAWAALDRDDLDAALALLDKVLAENPRNPTALRFASTLSRRQGDWDRAAGYLKQLGKHWPSEAWRYPYLRAKRDLQEGRFAAADKALGKLLGECETDDEASIEKCLSFLGTMVNLRLDRGDPKGAQRALRQLPLTDRHDLSTTDLLRLGNLLVKASMVKEAELHFQRMASRFPDVPDTFFALGNLHREIGRPQQAIVAFQRAIELDPSFLPAKNNLAVIYGSLGNIELSNTYLEDVIRWDPKNSRAIGNLGLNRYLQGQIDEAQRLFERAVELDPSTVRARLNLAQIYAQRQQSKRAVSLAREVIALDPDNEQAKEILRQLS